MAPEKFANKSEALDWLFANTNYEQVKTFRYNTRTFNVSRAALVLEALSNPEKAYPTVHVAGTKGKGSTCAITTSLLRAAGAAKVGLYTSPHLMALEERIAVNSRPIGDEDLRAGLEALSGPVTALTARAPELKPTFFEIFTVLSFLHFKRMEVDAAVIEVGLGGRLDATNVVAPVVTGITPVSYDHTGVLGNTLGAIAGEKAGIIKAGVPLVVGPQEGEALEKILAVAAEREAPVSLYGRDFSAEGRSPSDFAITTPRARYENLSIPLLGAHQRRNAATAVVLAETACEAMGLSHSAEAVRKGLANVNWPGRVEVVSETPPIVVDAAHNGASARALVEALGERFPGRKCVIVLAIAEHKDQMRVVEALAEAASAFVATTIDSPRSASAEELAEFVRTKTDVPVHAEPDRPKALALGRELAGDGLLVITGSFYLAGELRELLLQKAPGRHNA